MSVGDESETTRAEKITKADIFQFKPFDCLPKSIGERRFSHAQWYPRIFGNS